MVNSKIIGAIIAAIMIVGISFYITNLNDDSIASDVSEISPEIAISDSVSLKTGQIDSENNPDYFIDEDGVKSYIISAKDSPDLGD